MDKAYLVQHLFFMSVKFVAYSYTLSDALYAVFCSVYQELTQDEEEQQSAEPAAVTETSQPPVTNNANSADSVASDENDNPLHNA